MKLGKRQKWMAILMLVAIMAAAVGCKKSGAAIKVFEYEKNDDGTLRITGLTDKGKNDSKLTIPTELDGAKVVTIDAGAFRDDQLVTEVVIGDGVETIGGNVFLNCTALETITFPESIMTIGTNAFTDTQWERSQYENHTEIVVNDILVGVKTGMSEYTIPNSIRRIAAGVFYNNTDVKQIRMNDSVEYIGDYAFSGCTALTSMKLPDSVKEIGYCAFSNCTALDISIPPAVNTVQTDAFLNIAHLTYTGNLSGKPWGAHAEN